MSAFPRAGNTRNGWSPAPPSIRGSTVEACGSANPVRRSVWRCNLSRLIITPDDLSHSYLLMRETRGNTVIPPSNSLLLRQDLG